MLVVELSKRRASAIRQRQTGVESMSMNWLTTWFLAAATARAAPSHPHILLIVSDDLGWSDNNSETHAHKNSSRHVSIYSFYCSHTLTMPCLHTRVITTFCLVIGRADVGFRSHQIKTPNIDRMVNMSSFYARALFLCCDYEVHHQ